MAIHIENIWGDQLSWICVYTNTAQATTIAVVSTPVQLNRSSGLTTEVSKNMSVDSSGIITTGNAGLFLCQIHCSFSGASNDNFQMQWKIGGIASNPATIKWTQKGGNFWEVSSGLLVEIDNGQDIDLIVQNDTDTSNLTLENFTQTIIKLY